MRISKVEFRRLEVSDPPVPAEGGIIVGPSGDLFHIVNGQAFRFLSYVEFLPESQRWRGNHYHQSKVETLIVLTGRLKASFVDLDTSERYECEIGRGDIVTVQPRCAHAYYPLEFSGVVEIAPSEVAASDTYPFGVGSQLRGPT